MLDGLMFGSFDIASQFRNTRFDAGDARFDG